MCPWWLQLFMKSNTIQHFAKWDSSPDHSTNLHSLLLIMVKYKWLQKEIVFLLSLLVRFTDLSLGGEHNRCFIYSIQTKWNMCKTMQPRGHTLPGCLCGWSLAKLFKLRCFFFFLLLTGGTAQSEKCQCQDSMHALRALASSKQLLQMVCTLCHPLSHRCSWRAIN